jgi:hypothetical protein
MPVVYPNHGPGLNPAAPLDGLRAIPAGGAYPYPYGGKNLSSNRLTEASSGLPSPLPANPPMTRVLPASPVKGLMTALPGPKLEQ